MKSNYPPPKKKKEKQKVRGDQRWNSNVKVTSSHVHQKYIYMWNDPHRISTNVGRRFPASEEQDSLMELGRTKKKEKKKTKN